MFKSPLLQKWAFFFTFLVFLNSYPYEGTIAAISLVFSFEHRVIASVIDWTKQPPFYSPRVSKDHTN